MGVSNELTAKEERFAQLAVDLGNQSEAYRQAYNSKAKQASVAVEASKLANKPNVSLRISELKEQLAEACLWSREDSVRTLANIAKGGDAEARASDKVSAVKAINQMNGWDKMTIDHTSNDGSMTPQLVERHIVDPKD